MIELSGNPDSSRPTLVADHLSKMAARFKSEEFKKAWEALQPTDCACCVQSLFEDTAAMLRDYALTPQGKELDESF